MTLLSRARKYLSRSIRRKFVFLVVIPLLSVVAAMMLIVSNRLSELTADNIEANIVNRVTIAALNIDRVLSQVSAFAELNASVMEIVVEPDEERTQFLLLQTLEANPIVFGATIAWDPYAFDPNLRLFSPFAFREGNEVRFTDLGDDADGRGYDYTDGTWEWWSGPRESLTGTWTDTYFDEGGGNVEMFSYGTPFYRNGELKGLSTIDIQLESMFELMGSVEGGFNAILKSNGDYIYNANSASTSVSILDRSGDYLPGTVEGFLQTASEQDSGIIRFVRAGPPRPDAIVPDSVLWTVYARIPSTDWIYQFFTSEAQLFEPVREQQQFLQLMFLLLVLLTLALLGILSRLLVRPITELSEATGQLAHGNYDARVHYNSSDELGRLASVFNRMAGNIKGHQQELESKVALRTKELSEAQARLSDQNVLLEQRVVDLDEARKATLAMMEEADKARIELADQNSLLQTLIDTNPYPLSFRDLDGRYMGINDAFANAFGLSKEQIIGKQHMELFPDSSHLALMSGAFQAAVEKGETTRQEIDVVYADGNVHESLYYISPFTNSEGNVAGVLGALVDISEQKRAAEQLELAKQKAESATEAKASFLATMSHEIRTPMNGVLGMVDLLRHTSLDEEQRQMLRTIQDSGQALLTIINDILDISKIEAGKLELEMTEFSMLEVIESTAETLAGTASRKDLALYTLVDPDIGEPLVGDPLRLRQIILNLVGNAIKFSDHGEIEVFARRVSSRQPDRISVRVSVQDHGIGISPEAQEKLFQPFSQAESSTTRRFGGTGLGLSICQRLVEMMQGEIGVNSQPGEGSEFHFTIELRKSAAARVPEYADIPEGTNVWMLSRREAEVQVCAQVLQALDCQFIRLDSMEALQRLASDNGSPRPSLIILGSNWDSEAQQSMNEHILAMPELSDSRSALLQLSTRVTAYLSKPRSVVIPINPLRQKQLLIALRYAVGQEVAELTARREATTLASAQQISVEEALENNSLILVAEDNPTNRDVIGRQLRLLGYACEMAEDGSQALTAWRTGRYAIILSDINMPSMDGMELTRAVRDAEQNSAAASRTPIIALTANALRGDEERYLSMGMNAYLSKPLDMSDLAVTLRQWIPHYIPQLDGQTANPSEKDDADSPGSEPTDDQESLECVDITALTSVFGDDMEEVREILNGFVAPSEAIMRDLEAGFAEQSAETLYLNAHKLKSAARTIGANTLADLCQDIELKAKQGNLDSLEGYWDKMKVAVNEVNSFITSFK